MKPFALISLMLLAAATAPAAEDGALSVAPAVVMLHGNFGQSTKQTLTLTNTTSREFAFEMEAEDVVVRNGKRLFVPAGGIAGSIAATAVFTRRQVVVKAHTAESVDVTVTLPTGAKHRGVVAIFHGRTRFLNGRVPMIASLGTLLTFSVTDDVAADAGSLDVVAQSATHNLGVAQNVVNSGAEPLMVRGVAAILDSRGALVGRMDLQPRRIFPTERAKLEGEYPGELSPGHYRLVVTCDLGAKSVTRSTEVEVR